MNDTAEETVSRTQADSGSAAAGSEESNAEAHVVVHRRSMTLRQCDTDISIDRHLIPFLQNVPFFAEISRRVRKRPTRDLPTMGVTFDPENDDITLYWNPDYVKSLEGFNEKQKDLGDTMIHALLTHEFYHLVFRHLSTRRKTPHKWWNIATDAAINSIITHNDNNRGGVSIMPPGGIIPGQWPTKPDGRDLSKEEKDAAPFAAEIASWPTMQASEVYYMLIQRYAEEQRSKCPVHGDGSANKQKGKQSGKKGKGQKGDQSPQDGQGDKQDSDQGQSGKQGDEGHSKGGKQCTCGASDPDGLDDFDSIDSHDPWDDIPDDMREFVEGRLRELVRRAVNHADTHPSGWGNMPAEMQAEIRKSVSNEVDWRKLLRQFFGTLIRGDRSTSIKRINKRYPYVHPGVKRNHVPKVLIAYDRSGSVGDEACELFFGECATLGRNVDFDVVEFDTDCSPVQTWRRGGSPPSVARNRTRKGGTDFNAPVRLIDAPENRGKWDGLIYMTDGECSEPTKTRIKRAWVIAPGRTLLFATTDTVINLTREQAAKGAWR